MSVAAYLIIAVFVTAAIAILTLEFRAGFRRFRGRRVVKCPETQAEVYVKIDPAAAAIPSAIGWPPDYRVRDCSRWPGRRYCGQRCVLDIAKDPDTTLMRAVESIWYAGKRCTRCDATIDSIDWEKGKPALLSPTHVPVRWQDIPPESLREVLSSYSPLCGECVKKIQAA